MKPVYVSVMPAETGSHIRSLMNQNGITVKDVKEAMGFEQPQAVYKWLSGQSLPSLDNLVILSRVLHVAVDELLVVTDGEFPVGSLFRKSKSFGLSGFYGWFTPLLILCAKMFI